MSIHRRAAKRDDNEDEIIKALKQVGCSVSQLSGTGVPDLLVGFRQHTYLLEVKERKGTFTAAQKWWHETWLGQPAVVVRSVEEALRAIGATN